MIKKNFIDGLENQLKIWVLQGNPKTADEALQITMRSENNFKHNKHEAAACNTNSFGPNTVELAEAIAMALEKRGIGNDHAHTGNFNRRGSFRGRGRGRGRSRRGNCLACGQEGHFWRDAIYPNAPKDLGNGQGIGNGWSDWTHPTPF